MAVVDDRHPHRLRALPHREGDAPADLLDWPLLYHHGWEADWPWWFARHGAPAPDLTAASGFRVYDMLVSAALDGLGVAVGCPSMIVGDIERGALVPLFDRGGEVPMRYCLFTPEAAWSRPEVQDVRTWILQDVATGGPANAPLPATAHGHAAGGARADSGGGG